MKICAGICVYADAEGLHRCLSTLGLGEGGFDGAIVIHRRFEHFEMIEERSLEETKLVAKKFPNVHVDHSDEPISQVDARSLYFKLAGELGYDWLMVIDSDEYVLPNADWQTFRSQLDYVRSLNLEHQIFDIEFEGSLMQRGPRPRLFKDPGTIKYYTKHFWFVLTKSNILYKGLGDSGRIITGINVYHSKIIRSLEHIRASEKYYMWQELLETAPTGEKAWEIEAEERLNELNNIDKTLTARVRKQQ